MSELNPDLFNYAHYRRPTGPRGGDTSRAALAVVEHSSATVRANVKAHVALMGPTGATGDEIASALIIDKYAVRPRTSELRAAGEIVDSGMRRKSQSGVASIVWVLAEYAPQDADAA